MSEYLAIVVKMVVVLLSLFALTFCIAGAYAVDKEFRKCAGCHKIDEGKKGGMGPNLFNIYDNKAGLVPGYRYSKWLKDSGIVWTRENLHAWLSKRAIREKKFGKESNSTKMMFTGIKDEQELEQLLDYLKEKTK